MPFVSIAGSLKTKLVPSCCSISLVTVLIPFHADKPTDKLNEMINNNRNKRILRLYLRRKYKHARFRIVYPPLRGLVLENTLLCYEKEGGLGQPDDPNHHFILYRSSKIY